MKIFKQKEKQAEAVTCEDARDVLLQQTGLRIVCPDDIDENPTVLGNGNTEAKEA